MGYRLWRFVVHHRWRLSTSNYGSYKSNSRWRMGSGRDTTLDTNSEGSSTIRDIGRRYNFPVRESPDSAYIHHCGIFPRRLS